MTETLPENRCSYTFNACVKLNCSALVVKSHLGMGTAIWVMTLHEELEVPSCVIEVEVHQVVTITFVSAVVAVSHLANNHIILNFIEK